MAFINSFASYLLLLLVIVVLCGISIFVGITLRKRKNAQIEAAVEEKTE